MAEIDLYDIVDYSNLINKYVAKKNIKTFSKLHDLLCGYVDPIIIDVDYEIEHDQDIETGNKETIIDIKTIQVTADLPTDFINFIKKELWTTCCERIKNYIIDNIDRFRLF